MTPKSRHDFYRDRAEACEERAREAADEAQRQEWLRMAEDWRVLIHWTPANDEDLPD